MKKFNTLLKELHSFLILWSTQAFSAFGSSMTSFAALCTVVLLLLLQAGRLEIWHLYCLNALNGFMNTLQQPAADVTISSLSPKEHYQKVSGMRSFSNSLVSIFTPIFATAMLTLFGIQAVILFDLVTFGVAFLALLFFVTIPKIQDKNTESETVFRSARAGLQYLKANRVILDFNPVFSGD